MVWVRHGEVLGVRFDLRTHSANFVSTRLAAESVMSEMDL